MTVIRMSRGVGVEIWGGAGAAGWQRALIGADNGGRRAREIGGVGQGKKGRPEAAAALRICSYPGGTAGWADNALFLTVRVAAGS